VTDEDSGESKRKSASSATTLAAPETGGHSDPYHSKHCDTAGTMELGPAPQARKSLALSSGGKSGSKRGHGRSASGGSAPMSVASPRMVSAPTPTPAQGRSTTPRTIDYATASAYTTPTGSLRRNTVSGQRAPIPMTSSKPQSQPHGHSPAHTQSHTRTGTYQSYESTNPSNQQYDSVRSQNTLATTTSGHNFDSMRTPTSLYDPITSTPDSTLRRPSRLPGGRITGGKTRPSLWAAAGTQAEAAPKPQANKVFNYYTTPTGEYRTPMLQHAVTPRTMPSSSPSPHGHHHGGYPSEDDLEDQASPTSADFSPDPIPGSAHGHGVGLGLGHVRYDTTSSSGHGGNGSGNGHLRVPTTQREPSWVSASAWSGRRGRRRAPSDPTSTHYGSHSPSGTHSNSNYVRPPVSTAAGSSFSSYALVSPPSPQAPVHHGLGPSYGMANSQGFPAPILLHPPHTRAGQQRTSAETEGSSTAVGSGHSHGNGNGYSQTGGAALSRTNSKTESFKRVRRNSVKAIAKIVSVVADAFSRVPVGTAGEGAVRSASRDGWR
jgi:hypothetical protein